MDWWRGEEEREGERENREGDKGRDGMEGWMRVSPSKT